MIRWFKRYMHDMTIAMESIMANKLRSILTALGIIFGVAAVISMLAIGRGAKQEILEQIKMVGVNNIVITPIVQESTSDNSSSSSSTDQGESKKNKFSRGLSLLDVAAIQEVLPSVKKISPEVSLNSFVTQNGRRYPAKIIGVSNDYFEIFNLPLEMGTYFTDYHEEFGITVCVVGSNIKNKFFAGENPIGKYIKFGNVWLKIIGVLEKNNITVSAFQNTGVNVMNDNIFVPVKTMLLRYQNRALVNTKQFQTAVEIHGFGFMSIRASSPSGNTYTNYHQLDRIIVQVKETEQLTPSTEMLSRMMYRRHSDVKDFEITVPELLLKQQQRTKDIFNIVLGAIASISLIVGGIGIMNIMFANVMERIKEIGTRLAIGANKMDIVVQFLSEAVLISVAGGFIGVVIGVIFSKVITQLADILTIITPFSVIVAFGVSATVGVIFGYTPAKRASEKDPIESLRYE
jgi:putative ABC transport system permease protein